jgi:two-component system phosphate regulon sensor histidine kinase PhoR
LSWLQSKLFWKIAGLYVLLSAPAVLGLVATLHTSLHRKALEQHQSSILRQLRNTASEISGFNPDSDTAQINSLRKNLPPDSHVLLLTVDGRSLESPPSSPVSDITLLSAVSAADNEPSAESIRTIKPSFSSHELLAACRKISTPHQTAFLLVTSNPENAKLEATQTAAIATQSAAITWLLGTFCLLVVAASIVSPLQVMSRKLQSSVQRDDRDDMLLNVSDRHDEVGDVASALYQLEDQLQDRILSLELAGKEAAASVNLLTAVLDSMIEGVIAVDQQQRMVFINPGARRLLSISDAIQPGHRLYEAVRITPFLETVEESLQNGSMNSLEYRAPRDNAHHVLVVIPIQKGPHPGAVVVVRDISDVRRLEAMRRDFVSGVSHELKTPLTVIQACTDTLLAGALEDHDSATHFLKQIEEQAERLLQLILKMLQLARVESGQEILHFQSFDAAATAAEVLRSLKPIADAQNVQLRQDGPPQLILHSDQQALQTILSNLLDNALKHTPPGGIVSLSVQQHLSDIVFTVKDTGEGIPDSLLDRIFERFYRVEKDRSRERGGSGLGLAIVKHLCQSLGAKISVLSKLGEGSQFQITFPRQ